MSDHPTRESRADCWRAHVETWRSGGQSQKAYCQANALSYSSFLYWRRRFQQDREPPGSGARPGFVPVAYTMAESGEGLRVVLPSGVELRGITADNLSVVEQLLSRWS
jgi:hypothetical protein